MSINEKAAYLKGLADGLEIDNTTKEGKLIAALIDLTQELCAAVEMLDTDMDEVACELEELREYIEEIDEDLSDVEDFLDEECCCEDDEDHDDLDEYGDPKKKPIKPMMYTDIATDHEYSSANTAHKKCEKALAKLKEAIKDLI